jgi:hypothetical protein
MLPLSEVGAQEKRQGDFAGHFGLFLSNFSLEEKEISPQANQRL